MLFRLFIILLIPMTSSAQEISLVDFLRQAWEKGPVSQAEGLQNSASDEFVHSVQGKYLPHVALDAIDSTGFPASNSALQVGGLMGSPFRSGAAGGVVVTQTVYDFGRIESALKEVKAERSLVQARLAEDKMRYLESAAQVYLACARARSLQENDEELMKWAKINLKETARFTRTGQRSVIDNSLVQTEVNELRLELDDLGKFQQSLTEQMKLYGANSGCKTLSDSWDSQVPEALRVDDPRLLLAKAQMETAHAGFEDAKSRQLPTINVMGSAGGMEKSRLVPEQDYAAGVGIVFPVWNGGEDYRREKAFKTQSDYQDQHLKAAELEFNVQIKNLQDELSRDRDALKVVGKNLEQVEKTIKLASTRYQRLEGPLIDVREALKQLRQLGLERVEMMNSLGAVSVQLSIWRNK